MNPSSHPQSDPQHQAPEREGRSAGGPLADDAERFRLLVGEATDYAIFFTDSERRIADWNAGAERTLGYSAEEVIGQSADFIFTPEDRAQGAPAREARTATDAGRAVDERWHVRKDGTRFWGSGVVTALRDEAGGLRGFCKIVRDLTERKRGEDALRASEEALLAAAEGQARATREAEAREREMRELADGVPHQMWISGPRGGVAFFNRGFYEYTGLTEGEATGVGWRGIVHPDDLPGCLASREEALRTGQPWRYEYRLRGEDGQYRWHQGHSLPLFDASGAITKWVGTATDIDEAVRAREVLTAYADKEARVSEALQRSLLMSPPPDAFPGITFKAFYDSAHDDALIGGDIFDVFAVAEDRVAVVVADVSGKGLEAATYTAELKFALRAFLREDPDPATALARLNSFVMGAERLDAAHLGSTYAAAAVALIDTRAGELLCASAGMEPPFVLNAQTGEAIELVAGGTMLGALPGAEYDAQRFALSVGDLLVMTTDGITEARNARREFFGYDGLVRAVREAVAAEPSSVSAIGENVLVTAKGFAGGKLQDDVCLVLVRRIAQPDGLGAV